MKSPNKCSTGSLLCYVMLCYVSSFIYVSIENKSGVQSDKETTGFMWLTLQGPQQGSVCPQRHNMVKIIGQFELNLYKMYEQCQEILKKHNNLKWIKTEKYNRPHNIITLLWKMYEEIIQLQCSVCNMNKKATYLVTRNICILQLRLLESVQCKGLKGQYVGILAEKVFKKWTQIVNRMWITTS